MPIGHIKNTSDSHDLDGQEEDNVDDHDSLPSRHYRRFYPIELEKATDVMDPDTKIFKSPFRDLPIFRNKKRGSSSILKGLFGSSQDDEMTTVEVGYFKCSINVFSPNDELKNQRDCKDELNKLMEIVRDIYYQKKQADFPFSKGQIEKMITQPNKDSKDKLMKIRDCIYDIGLKQSDVFPTIQDVIENNQLINILSKSTQCRLRVYFLEAYNLAQKDIMSPSDPYLIVKCGKEMKDDRENYILDCSDPKFYKSFDFNIEFPGAPLLEIFVNDYDDFFGDDLIGCTKIDLDDRYFSQGWNSIKHKPIEFRDLYEESSTVP